MSTAMKTIAAAAVLLLLCGPGAGRSAADEVLLASPAFPPEGNPADCDALVSRYQAPAGAYLFFDSGLPLSLKDPTLECFELVEREQLDPDTQRQMCQVRMTVFAQWSYISGAATLLGTMETITRSTGTAGQLSVEVVALDVSTTFNGAPVVIRESPLLDSSGTFSALDLGDGLYAVQSALDLNVELVGDIAIPSAGPVHLDLVGTGAATPTAAPGTWGGIKAMFR